MYTAYIGRRIVGLYNEHRNDGAPLTPSEFFDEVYFPLFFDSETYLIKGGNSTFGQLVNNAKNYKREVAEAGGNWAEEAPRYRREALASFHEKVRELDEPLMHLFLGGIASKVTASTSGQVSTALAPAEDDEVYCSWIGGAAAIGLKGGYNIALDAEPVLLALLDGWHHYRRFLDETPRLEGNQVESWNGWWLTHRFNPRFDKQRPFRDFEAKDGLKKRGDSFRLDTQDWVKVLFALARQFPEQHLTAYVFTFGNTNKTMGFRQLRLPEVRRFADLYIHLFGEADGINDSAQLASLYQTEFGFREVCGKVGTIGLRAIQPKKLRDYGPMRGGAKEKKKPKPPKNDSQRLTYHQYLTWIIAMLDNKDLISLSEEAARALRTHASSSTKGRTTQKREAEQVLDASGRRAFIDGLTEIVQGKDAAVRERLDELVNAIIGMPASDFPLLLTLMRFKYHAQA